MRIPRRKLFTQRQIARLDAHWWSMAFADIAVMKEGIRNKSKWNFEDNQARINILDEFDEALRWFTEMRRGNHGS
jgi:hypothetical protein